MSRCSNHPTHAVKKTTCAPCRRDLPRGTRIYWQRGRPLCEPCAVERGLA